MSNCIDFPMTDFNEEKPMPSVFSFSGHKVRITLDDQGIPWFVVKDVCEVLDIGNSRQACQGLKDKNIRVITTDTNKGFRKATAVSESGLYSLIFKSRKPSAESFKDWVMEEVLPTLRKTGRYEPKTVCPTDVLAQVLHTLNRSGAALQQMRAERQFMAPKAAFYDQYRNTQGKHGLQATAKIIGLKPNTFIQQLIADGLLFRRDKCLTAGEAFIKLGWFTTKLFVHPETRMPIHRTMVTPKGLLVFAKQYGWRSDLLTTPQHQ